MGIEDVGGRGEAVGVEDIGGRGEARRWRRGVIEYVGGRGEAVGIEDRGRGEAVGIEDVGGRGEAVGIDNFAMCDLHTRTRTFHAAALARNNACIH